eukprot:EC791608.1.p7 GENE.EC791608.1~~EC791608.1.p7  ORF type:complete len:50 (-),score=6.84 EC791608.1:123-272(-)
MRRRVDDTKKARQKRHTPGLTNIHTQRHSYTHTSAVFSQRPTTTTTTAR